MNLESKEVAAVRMIYDDVGCISKLPAGYYKKMEARGIKCTAFNPFRPIMSIIMNNRQGFSFYRFYLLHIYTFCVLRLQVLFLNSSYRHDHKPLIKKRKKSLSVLWAALWN